MATATSIGSLAFRERPYQTSAREAAFEELAGCRSTLLVMATGTGKTNVAASLVHHWPISHGRILFLAHRDELILQAERRMRQLNPRDIVQVEQGSRKATRQSRVAPGFQAPRIVVASKDTLTSKERLNSFGKSEFGLIIVDEAHHALAHSYRRILEYFDQSKICGITATPDRGDEKALGKIFETVAYVYPVLNAIEDGYLVPIVQQYASVTGYDLSRIPARRDGDLSPEELDRYMRQEKLVHGIAEVTVSLANKVNRWGSRRPTLVFCSSVAHAQLLADILNRRHSIDGSGMAANASCDTLEQRRAYLEMYKRGEIQYLCNCGVLTEGTDLPSTRVVVMARPTCSRALYEQIIGRGLRPEESLASRLSDIPTAAARREAILHSGKPSCLIVDLVGNSGKHKLVTCPDILGGEMDDSVVSEAKSRILLAGGMGDAIRELQAARHAREEAERQRRRNIVIRAGYVARMVNPFDLFDVMPGREPGWFKGKKATEKQRACLMNAGIPEDRVEKLSLHEASTLIDEVMRRRREKLATFGQMRVLSRYGFPATTTFDRARELLDALGRRKWPKPDRFDMDKFLADLEAEKAEVAQLAALEAAEKTQAAVEAGNTSP